MKLRLATSSAIALLLLSGGASGCATSAVALPPPITPTQREVLLSTALAPSSESRGANEYERLGISLKHFVPDSEWEELMQTCVSDQLDGVLAPSEAPTDIAEECELRYPPAHLRDEIRTPAEWSYEYSYLRNFFVGCVRLHGVSVGRLPSFGQYIAAARAFQALDPSLLLRGHLSAVVRQVVLSECDPTAPGLP